MQNNKNSRVFSGSNRFFLPLFVIFFMTWVTLSMPGVCRNNDNQNMNNPAKKERKKPDNIKVTFVELGSIKCIPCKKMQPIMEEIKKEYKGQVKVVFHDVWTDEGRPYASTYKIRIIPTQVFLDKNGKEYFRHEGFFPKEELMKILKMKGVK